MSNVAYFLLRLKGLKRALASLTAKHHALLIRIAEVAHHPASTHQSMSNWRFASPDVG